MTPLTQDQENAIKSIIAEFAYVDGERTYEIEKLQPNHDLEEDLWMDELDILEMAMAVEDDFGIELDDGAIDNCTTVKKVFEAVEQQL